MKSYLIFCGLFLMAFVFSIFLMAVAYAADIIPVAVWPTRIGNAVYNPTADQCVKAGYRLIPATKPATPIGKRIKSERFVQDPNKVEACKYEITYEDIPEEVVSPVVRPEKLTNIPSARVSFNFTTNGIFKGATWLDAPATNGN